MQIPTEKDYKKILACLTFYITSLFTANTLGIKLMPFLFGTHLSVAVFCFPIVFIMTDVIGEVYGKKRQPLALIENVPIEFVEKINKKELKINPKDDLYLPLFGSILKK